MPNPPFSMEAFLIPLILGLWVIIRKKKCKHICSPPDIILYRNSRRVRKAVNGQLHFDWWEQAVFSIWGLRGGGESSNKDVRK